MSKFKLLILLYCIFNSHVSLIGSDLRLERYKWTTIDAKGDVTGRHENGFIEYKGKFYLIGGRGINPVNVFDPKTNTWETKSKSPIQIHHFQPVVYGDAIYMVGAMTGGYPAEPPLEHVWIYYPETDTWKQGVEIPAHRRRGGAGTAVFNNKIYMVGGIKLGHTHGTTNYFDCYDPETGQWSELTDAPHIRDHFAAIIADNKLYCIGGRNTSVHNPDNFGAFFSATIPQVDYFDFKQGKWFTLKEELPVPTAAGGIVAIENFILYIGGEGTQAHAYTQTQCLNTLTGKWSQLATLNTGRHGSGAILYNNNVYLAAGSPVKGGGNMNSIEVFSLNHSWKSLFNGTDLVGWNIKTAERNKHLNFWYVEDGAIVCNSIGSKTHGYLWLQSQEEYGDFELRFLFQSDRANKGNSGVQIRSRWDENGTATDLGNDVGWMDGPQIDIDPQNAWRNGYIYDETRGVRHWINPVLPDWKIDKETYAPKKVIHYFADENPSWNYMTIICKGTRIQTFVNNIMVSDYEGKGVLDDKIHRKHNVGLKGHIAFQLHMNGENLLRFKDIEIREL